MNDGMFMALRAEAQETNSLLKQLLGEQQRTNELLGKMTALPKLATPIAVDLDNVKNSVQREMVRVMEEIAEDKPATIPPDAVGPVTAETVQTVDAPTESKPKASAKKGK